jgi:hypothetical protein
MKLLQLLASTEWLRGDRLCTWKGDDSSSNHIFPSESLEQETTISLGRCLCRILPTTSWALEFTGLNFSSLAMIATL